ncbi:hypothetical protein DB32_007888 [Sandaracinus amylolyticus]|uniref:Uncharacterized protein n=1 Tax=Sandaracinus amylolyticus TaxID=927083 RepID=A0A0F6SHN2_9BACT|nr:hypothetical protein DB32_007888 [Sandaracinus amylolyticus]
MRKDVGEGSQHVAALSPHRILPRNGDRFSSHLEALPQQGAHHARTPGFPADQGSRAGSLARHTAPGGEKCLGP